MNAASVDPNLLIFESPYPDLRSIPGQFFLGIAPSYDPYLPLVLFPFRMRGGLVESFIAPPEVEPWARQGSFKIRGPYGKGFALPEAACHVLVLATNAATGMLLLPLVDSLVAANNEVAILCGTDALRDAWLPPEVELHVVDDVLASASPLWDWSDAVYASGHAGFYDQLAATVKIVRLRAQSGWAQVLLHDLAMPCGTGVCYLCSLKARRGIVLNCRDGPVYDLADWMVEA